MLMRERRRVLVAEAFDGELSEVAGGLEVLVRQSGVADLAQVFKQVLGVPCELVPKSSN